MQRLAMLFGVGLILGLAVFLAGCGETNKSPIPFDGNISVSITPASSTIAVHGTKRLTATVNGAADTRVIWSVLETQGAGSISAEGLYTAPAQITGTYKIVHVVATSAIDATKSGSATIRIEHAGVTITPNTATLVAGHSKTFTANVTLAQNTGVNWAVVDPAHGGAIAANGTYTAPQTPGVYEITATSQQDPTQQATATITVVANDAPEAHFTVSQLSGDVRTTFAFDASGCLDAQDATSALQVAWDFNGDQINELDFASDKQVTHQFDEAGQYRVRMTVRDADGQTTTAEQIVTVSVATLLSPQQVTVAINKTVNFSAMVLGDAQNQGVQWRVVEAGGGSISADGVYTAPAAPGQYTVEVASKADPTQTATATVTVQAVDVVIIVQ